MRSYLANRCQQVENSHMWATLLLVYHKDLYLVLCYSFYTPMTCQMLSPVILTCTLMTQSFIVPIKTSSQCSLSNLEVWMASNQLKFNPQKSVVMIIWSRQKIKDNVFINGTRLKQVSDTKYLGVIVDKHLTWDEHTSYILQRVRSKLSSINRLKPLPPNLLRLIYWSYVLTTVT